MTNNCIQILIFTTIDRKRRINTDADNGTTVSGGPEKKADSALHEVHNR